MAKGIIALAVVIVIAAGAYWVVNQREPRHEPIVSDPNTSTAMPAEKNMVVITDQEQGNTVRASLVHLTAPGFVVIHEDDHGMPGKIIGFSALLQAGESSQVLVKLSKAELKGAKLHAMLHNDSDGNGKFDAAVDMPVQSSSGGPIEGWFNMTSDAAANLPVSI